MNTFQISRRDLLKREALTCYTSTGAKRNLHGITGKYGRVPNLWCRSLKNRLSANISSPPAFESDPSQTIMNVIKQLFFSAALPLAALACHPLLHAEEPTVNVIFDSDVDHDCDDIGALFMLHGAVQRGEAKLLATMGCTSTDEIAPALDAINTWFGRPEIPVGTLKDEGFMDHKGFAADLIKHYPSKFSSGKDYPDAVTLYREILAKQPDGRVTILAVGPLRNIANLLKSRPDKASPLDGKALVAQKVKRLEIMGGTYPPLNIQEGEFNFKQDPAASALVCSTWPTPVLFNGEGGSTLSGRRVTYEMPEHNPLTMAYGLSAGVGFAADRLSWDPISTLVAVRGAAPWYEVVSGGTNVADAKTGMNHWVEDKDGGHSYLVLKSQKAVVEKALEDMQTSGEGHPTNLKFNTIYYADAGMCRVRQSGERDQRGVWKDKASSSWIQYQHVDARKRLVTSYVVTCKDKDLLPSSLELSGSNDDGTSWTRLDLQETPGFSEQTSRRDFTIANPAKWNLYRLKVEAADEKEGIQVDSLELLEAIDCTTGVKVASVALDHAALTIPVNGRATLNASPAPLVKTFEREIKWVSSDPSVAEVRQIGEQVAMVVGKKAGTCTVTGSVDGQKTSCAITITGSTLPDGWGYEELNTPPIPGSLVVSNGKFSLTGCGNAMVAFWERIRDQGVFASRPVTENVELTAQLTDLSPHVGGPIAAWNNRPHTASGLMIRELLSEPVDRFFLVQVEAPGNLVCRWRDKPSSEDGGQSKELGKVSLPLHLKLSRKGNEIQVFTSADGKDWGEPRMSHSATLSGESRIGFFVCSGNTFASSTATFDNVELSFR